MLKRYRYACTAIFSLILSLASSAHIYGQTEGINVTATTIFAVTSTNQLIRFNSRTPGTVVTVGSITGLQGGENVVGMDFRPATGQLIALGSNSRLYSINKMTGVATFISTLSTPLSGTSFGVDFNPTVDRLRIVSNSGQNLRVSVPNGAAIVDGAINGPTTSVDGAAYTNSFNGATTTTLFDVSATTDTLYTQNPPNNGTLVPVGAGLGIDITSVNGLDISSIDNSALGAFTVGGITRLYSVSTTAGTASLVGTIGTGTTTIVGFAAETATTSNFLVYGLTVGNNLIKFNSSRPNTILSTTAITGLQGGESLLGIDFRPATGRLFGLGSTNRIYTINVATGAATSVGTLTTPLLGTNFGFDFNPVPDRIRITSDLEQNLRANPNDGTNVVDGVLAYAVGDVNAGANPNIVASGYTNSFAGTTTTTLYNIDSNLDILTIQNPPNNGTQNTVGSLGVDATGEAGFDIGRGSNTALAALQVPGGTSSALYSVNLTTGSAAIIAPIGGGAVVRDIAVARSTASGASTAQVDFDGDGKTDPTVFRVNENTWYVSRSSDGSFFALPFGISQLDVLTPGDYDGDGRTDIAVWRSSQGTFYVLRSSDLGVTTFQWGLPGDEPLARDYDGDGRTDFAVVRREAGQLIWYILNSSNGVARIEQFGLGSDVAAPADYDGDGRTDLAVHRGAAGQQATFFVQQSTLGLSIVQWGLGGDLVVPGDYDGDGRADYAVVRAGTPFVWYVLQSSTGNLAAAGFGAKPQFTTQGDYDGDGKTDFSTFDPLTGRFYWQRSIDLGIVEYQFGLNGDYPVANYQTH
jgi:FG-GAP repeat.